MDDWKQIQAEVDGEEVPAAPASVEVEVEETEEVAPAVETPEAKPAEEAKTEEVKTEDKAEAKPEDKTEQPRDDKGRFIPVDRHTDILAKQREREEARVSALEKENAELREKVSKIPAEPDESDTKFEERIANFPEEVQAVLREQREEVKTLRRERDEDKKAKDREVEATKEATEHESALAATETLAKVWEDKGLRTLLTTISNELIDNPEYKADSRAAHYKDVEKEFYQRYPALKQAATTETPPATKQTDVPASKAPIAPSSMSSIRGAIPESKSGTEAFEASNPLALATRTSSMSNEEFERYMASI